MKTIAPALIGAVLGLAVPAAAQAATLYDLTDPDQVRIVTAARIGGVDIIRAEAVAGWPVQPVGRAGLSRNDAIGEALEERGFTKFSIVGIFYDTRGTFWVYVDHRR